MIILVPRTIARMLTVWPGLYSGLSTSMACGRGEISIFTSPKVTSNHSMLGVLLPYCHVTAVAN